MRLTEDHVKRVHRDVQDTGSASTVTVFSETDYDSHLKSFLDERPDGPIQVFCYGSLIWKPVFEPVAISRAIATDWSRAFCLRMVRFRGTREQPGLMMQIDRGGSCEGVLHQIREGSEWKDLSTLWRREMTVKPPGNFPRWIDVEVDARHFKAIAFTANPDSPNYIGGLSADHIAETLSKACGHWGTGADYLRQTVIALEKEGIHDPYLWNLQAKVADWIEFNTQP